MPTPALNPKTFLFPLCDSVLSVVQHFAFHLQTLLRRHSRFFATASRYQGLAGKFHRRGYSGSTSASGWQVVRLGLPQKAFRCAPALPQILSGAFPDAESQLLPRQGSAPTALVE